MSSFAYSSGSWAAVVSEGLVALVGPDTSDETVLGLWEVARSGGGVLEALVVLSRHGFADLPPFALVGVGRDHRVHAALRGGIEVVVRDARGVRALRAGEVATWTERTARDAQAVGVRVLDDPAVDGATLPLVGGVVRASSVLLVGELFDEDEVAPGHAWEAAPEPIVLPEPEPEPIILPEPIVLPEPLVEPEPILVPEPLVEPEPVAALVAATVLDVAPAGDDHDGLTILSADLAQVREQLPAWSPSGPPDGTTLPAVDAAPLPVPVAPARIVLSTGLVVGLDRPVLIGRAPQVTRVTNRELPRLVTVPSPQHDISRTHAEVRQEGDHVLVVDLEWTNGVLVQQPGTGARRLHPGEPGVVACGEVVDLGDGVTFVVERG